ncbi:HHL286Wp [Eremothecium sinecaudum]|uniref:HHL286Wp n=1 Tax=Eremothecium sinecaudum TaxID=45286 RepID=A0A0X8HVW3_9SACH|nr:HHL286Wp [Eremothecium sinecaudum]AMD22484.1 HHL286Wp [Eremothecium sinecaudum]
MRVTPWKSINELQELKVWFYPNKFDSSSDLRSRGIARVKAYWTRGPYVPHAVDATSQLVACQIFDDNSAPVDAVKLSYTLALIRFVNGMLDPTQQSQFAIPLHTLAELNGLPSWFVELRHAGTHERDMISLEMLRMGCKEALDWLWEHYWDSNEVNDDTDSQKANTEEDPSDPANISKEDNAYLKKLTLLISSYKSMKRNFKEYDYLWQNGAIIPSSSFGGGTDSTKAFVTNWLAEYKETWKAFRHTPETFIEKVIANYDDTLLKLTLNKLEWADLEFCRWLLASYNKSIKEYRTPPLLKTNFVTAKKLLKLVKRVASGINIKQALHYWDRWLPVFEQDQTYLHSFILQVIEPNIKKALRDKKLRTKLNVEDLESQLSTLQKEISERGICSSELELFEADLTRTVSAVEPKIDQLREKRTISEDVSSVLEDLQTLKKRKPVSTTDAVIEDWSPHPNWVPRPFGCL